MEKQGKQQKQPQLAPSAPVQRAADGVGTGRHQAQLQAYAAIANGGAVAQRKATLDGGLPADLKSGIESLSGIGMDDVRVHYNSPKPAQLQAHAFAQGTDIHIASGQERHLPHEAWHVVQQKQGRVKPTLQLKGVAINDDSGLEREADVMGDKAMGAGIDRPSNVAQMHFAGPGNAGDRQGPIQRKLYEFRNGRALEKEAKAGMKPKKEGVPVTEKTRTEVLFPIKHVLTNAETRLTQNEVSFKGGHLLPVRWGGEGDHPNVLPWLAAFEDGKWKQLDDAVNAEANGPLGTSKVRVWYDLAVDDLSDSAVLREAVGTYTDLATREPDLKEEFDQLAGHAAKLGYIPNSIDGYVRLEFLSHFNEEQEEERSASLVVDTRIAYNAADLHGIDEKSILPTASYIEARLTKEAGKPTKFKAAPQHLKAAK